MRTVVGIRPEKRARQASSHGEAPTPTVWFASWRQLAGVLSDENRALLRLMQEKQPRTVLDIVMRAIASSQVTDQVNDQVTDQVNALLRSLGAGDKGAKALMQALGLSHRPSFRDNYLNPALDGGWIERAQPDAPRSPTQRYRLTSKGRQYLQQRKES